MEEFAATTRDALAAKNLSEAHSHLANILLVCAELEKVRTFFGAPVIISSGFRCPELNALVGGSKSSQHMTGSAADFTVSGYGDWKGMGFVFEWCRNHLNYGQLILEAPAGRAPWIHLGLPRPGRPRTSYLWDGKVYRPI